MSTPESGLKVMEERNWAMATHLAALAGLIFPFGNILGPLVVWLLKKDQFPLVNQEGKKSLNFQISLTIYFLIAAATMVVAIGFLLVPLVLVFGVVEVIIATVKTSQGERFEYHLSIPFIT